MTNNQVKLTGKIEYNPGYPPTDARKGYVAKITGRAGGGKKFEREFLGDEAEIFEGDEGLYERQIGRKKGGYARYYHVVLNHPQHGLIKSSDCENKAPQIAKMLDDGHAIDAIVEPIDIRPAARIEGLMIFDVRVRTPAAAKKAVKSASIESATDACWEHLALLPAPEAKEVLTALRKRLAES